jgi:hypothetical protein
MKAPKTRRGRRIIALASFAVEGCSAATWIRVLTLFVAQQKGCVHSGKRNSSYASLGAESITCRSLISPTDINSQHRRSRLIASGITAFLPASGGISTCPSRRLD